jgi:hypothetical protein
VLPDVLGAARCIRHTLDVDDAVLDGVFGIRDTAFVERED